MLTRTIQQVVIWLTALAFLSACSSIATFSQPAYEQATSWCGGVSGSRDGRAMWG